MKQLIFFIISILYFSSNIIAQKANKCDSKEYHLFDFWIGEWNVVDSTDNILGTNTVSIKQGRCLIHENWTGSRGTSGESLNYYDVSDSSWNQIWVDNKGSSLKLKGNISDGKMVLKSDLISNSTGNYRNVISWEKKGENVLQLWYTENSQNTNKKILFYGIYKPLKK